MKKDVCNNVLSKTFHDKEELPASWKRTVSYEQDSYANIFHNCVNK